MKRTGETLKEVSRELRDQNRRITRIEAKWEAAVELSVGRGNRRADSTTNPSETGKALPRYR